MRHLLTFACALAALAAVTAGSEAGATQWSFEPQLAWLWNYNSNLLLASSGEQASVGTTLSLDTTLKRVTDSTEMDLRPHLDLQRFLSDSALNANNGSLQGSFTAQRERSSITISAGHERVSTLTTELTETGIIDTNTRRETTSASVTFGHELSERQHLDLQGSYADVIYPDGEQVGLIGYRYPSISLTDTYGVFPLTHLSLTLFGDQLKAPQTGYDAHDIGARLTVTHEFSMRVKVSASAGATRTTQSPGEPSTQYGSVWDLHATRSQSERGQWDFDYSRTLQPSGRGYLVRRDVGNLSLSQNIAPQLYATVALQYVRNSDLASGVFLDVPRYSSADAGFDWHLSSQLVISVTGGAAELREPVTFQLARGWHMAVNTRWTPVPRSISR